MHVTVEMSEHDHFLATLFVGEATPTFLRPDARDVLAGAVLTGPGRTYRLSADVGRIENLRWAMDRCVHLIECEGSDAMEDCCEVFDHDYNILLDAAARRLEDQIDGLRSDVDHGGMDETHDGDLASCGPEYPRNDAGEWLGRM